MINTRRDYDYWDPRRKGFVTNYPNFQQWKKIDAEQMVDNRPLNIYLHSPFCIQRCSYCYYKTINLRGTEKRTRMEIYVDALCREIELASEQYNLKERPVISIYFGGGTPSLLYEEQLQKVVECLHNNLNINSPEFTLEAEPVTLTKKKADTLVELNVNRISMGVQSFDDEIIKASFRLDDEKKALKAIDLALQTGATINIDLMSGLADETPEKWAYSVERAISSGVQSITVYKTELYINTPYYRALRKQRLELPNDDQELELMRYAIDELQGAGYVPRSFTTFTKEGTPPHIHAPSIFRGADCYAFGVSAFGRLGNWLFQNSNNEDRYVRLLNEGQLPIQRGHELTSLDNMIRDVVLGMKLITLDLRDFQRKYGFKLESQCASTLEQLESDGYVTVSEDEIRLTSKGILHGDYTGKSLVKSLRAMYN